jgi:hypothetical protein
MFTVCTTCFNKLKLCILTTERNFVFLVVLKKNVFLKEH